MGDRSRPKRGRRALNQSIAPTLADARQAVGLALGCRRAWSRISSRASRRTAYAWRSNAEVQQCFSCGPEGGLDAGR